jgi:hypothetical protein
VGEPGGFPGFEVFHIRGNPTPDEESALLEVVQEYLSRDKPGPEVPAGATMSGWVLAGRLAGRRGGILDARTALGAASWPATVHLPWNGRSYDGRAGRGDQR